MCILLYSQYSLSATKDTCTQVYVHVGELYMYMYMLYHYTLSIATKGIVCTTCTVHVCNTCTCVQYMYMCTIHVDVYNTCT